MDIALPAELTAEQRRELIKSFVQEQFVQEGMVADVAIHSGTRKAKGKTIGDTRNHHAHVMLTMRKIDEDGFGKKVREWNDRERYKGWRLEWQKAVNRELELRGHEARIDCRTLEAQREEALSKGQYEEALKLTRAPQHHKGVVATNLERRGLESEKLQRMRKERPAELDPFLKARKEGLELLGELKRLEVQREREPGNQKFIEAQRQDEERRRQEEQRKAREDRELELARTDRGLFDTIVKRFNQDFSQAESSHYAEAKKAILERLKPEEDRINYLSAKHREQFLIRKSLEEESKRPLNRIRLLVDSFLAESVRQDIAGANEKRAEYAKEHKVLWDRRQRELSEENIMNEATKITWQKHPELRERGKKLKRLVEEWELKQNQPERKKKLEKRQEDRKGERARRPRP